MYAAAGTLLRSAAPLGRAFFVSVASKLTMVVHLVAESCILNRTCFLSDSLKSQVRAVHSSEGRLRRCIYVSSFFAKSWSLQRMLEVECRIVFHRLFPSFWQPAGAPLQHYCSLVAALVAVLLQPVGALVAAVVGALVAAFL